ARAMLREASVRARDEGNVEAWVGHPPASRIRSRSKGRVERIRLRRDIRARRPAASRARGLRVVRRPIVPFLRTGLHLGHVVTGFVNAAHPSEMRVPLTVEAHARRVICIEPTCEGLEAREIHADAAPE